MVASMENKNVAMVILALLGLAGLLAFIMAISGGGKAEAPKGKGNLYVKLRSDRAIGTDPNTGKTDYNTADVEVVSNGKVVYSTTVNGLRADIYVSFMVSDLLAGTYTINIYYPNKNIASSPTQTVNVVVKANMSTIVTIDVSIPEPLGYSSFTLDTTAIAIDPSKQTLYVVPIPPTQQGKLSGIVNGNVVSWILLQGTKIYDCALREVNCVSPFYYVVCKMVLTQDFKARIHSLLQTTEDKTTLEVLTFSDAKPYKDCRVVVSLPDGTIVLNKEVYDVGDNEYGIREILDWGAIYNIEIKNLSGTTTYYRYEGITLNRAKVHVVLTDIKHTWR